MNDYKLAEADYKKGMKYKDIAEKYNVSLNTVKSWKTRYWGKVADKKVCTQNKKSMHTKKGIKQAKALVEEGASLREASEKTGIKISTLGNYSAEENWIQNQKEYLENFRDKQRLRIRENKLRRLELNDKALDAIEYELNNWEENGRISKAIFEKLLMSEDLEQKILELDRIERLEKLEILKVKKGETQEGKLSCFLDKLDQLLDEEEEKVN